MSFLSHGAHGAPEALVLGTVQLGMPYGIANQTGKPDDHMAEAILGAAYALGIRILDTAQSYGDSEAVIGRYGRAHPAHAFRVISKLDPTLDHTDRSAVRDAVRLSVLRTGGPLAGIMLHDPSKLAAWNSGIARSLLDCRESGLVEAVGASVYTPQEFECAVGIADVQIIQAPFSVLDRRLRCAGLLKKAIEHDKLVILRSIFLQGLLLMDPEQLPQHLRFARADLLAWRALCSAHHVSPAAAALKYVQAAAPACMIVVGCETPEQVQANVNLLGGAPLASECFLDIEALPVGEERLINPSLWHEKQ
jgi:aryl-alcohol dehydrogenase-like predicted oxidoreductase